MRLDHLLSKENDEGSTNGLILSKRRMVQAGSLVGQVPRQRTLKTAQYDVKG